MYAVVAVYGGSAVFLQKRWEEVFRSMICLLLKRWDFAAFVCVVCDMPLAHRS